MLKESEARLYLQGPQVYESEKSMRNKIMNHIADLKRDALKVGLKL